MAVRRLRAGGGCLLVDRGEISRTSFELPLRSPPCMEDCTESREGQARKIERTLHGGPCAATRPLKGVVGVNVAGHMAQKRRSSSKDSDPPTTVVSKFGQSHHFSCMPAVSLPRWATRSRSSSNVARLLFLSLSGELCTIGPSCISSSFCLRSSKDRGPESLLRNSTPRGRS